MDLKSVSSIVYYVSDVQKSIAFYEALGFKQNNLKQTRPRVYLNWFSIEFRERQNDNQIAGNGQETCIKVESVDNCYTAIQKLGLTATKPSKNLFGTHHFSLFDPDGYTLTFFE